MKKIRINGSWVPLLAAEFETSENTVRQSLRYLINSDLAIKIRKKALDKLKKESQKPVEIEFEED